MLRQTQMAVLQLLSTARNAQNPEYAKVVGYSALTILGDNNPQVENEIKYLIENGYLTPNKSLTRKGELAAIVDPRHFSDLEVSKRMNSFTYTSLERGVAKTAISHWNETTLSQMFELILAEIFERTQTGEVHISEDAVAYIDHFKTELQVSTPENVLIEDVIVEKEEVKEKPKRARKTKEGVI